MQTWQPIENPPDKPMAVILFHGAVPQLDALPPYREVRCEIGYWNGESFREAMTGHDCFEIGGEYPTHWMPLPEPPSSP